MKIFTTEASLLAVGDSIFFDDIAHGSIITLIVKINEYFEEVDILLTLECTDTGNRFQHKCFVTSKFMRLVNE